VVLRAGIGDVIADLHAIARDALVDDVLFDDPKQSGTWIEFGVTGIECEVRGASTRRVWLPRQGSSDAAEFVVGPTKSGIARVRLCVYARNHLVQSFLVSIVTGSGTAHRRPAGVGRALAAAVGEDPRRVSSLTWAYKLEYATTAATSENIARLSSRDLSILANDLDGVKRVTVKATDVHGDVEVDASAPSAVEGARDLLLELSRTPNASPQEADWPYAYATGAGDRPDKHEATLRAAMPKLAEQGRALWAFFLPDSKELERALTPDDRTVQVAHTLFENSIPWSLLYTRPYASSDLGRDDGLPVVRDVCLAWRPEADGSLPDIACAESVTCVLHPDAVAARRIAGEVVRVDTVACPRHVLGLRHQIEVPVQQHDDSLEPAAATAVTSEPVVHVAIGVNDTLRDAETHIEAVTESIMGARAPAPSLAPVARDASAFQALLELTDVDLLYLFCHALPSSDGVPNPYLLLATSADGVATKFASSDLVAEPKLLHRPIVILNACDTAGFDPRGVSRLVSNFVKAKGAGAVIGTEVSVLNELARRAGEVLVTELLRVPKRPIGQALAVMRRRLLAEYNPLGLVYTLYGPLDMTGP
jgi:hypothetical protein